MRPESSLFKKTELYGLQIFFDLASAYIANTDPDKSINIPAQSERKTLFELALWSKGLTNDEAVDVVTMDMGQMEDRLAIVGIKRPNIFPLIQRAEDYGMLTIHKTMGRISVYPGKMRQIIASMNIIMTLEQDQKAIAAEVA